MVFNSLPINKEGFMKYGAKQAALYSIMTADEYAGDLHSIVSRFLIKDNCSYIDYFSNSDKFKSILKNTEVELDEKYEELSFFSHPYEENKYAYVYTDIINGKQYSGIEVKIDYIQNSDAWSNVKIIFSDGINNFDEIERKVCFYNECSLKITAQGRLIFEYGNNHEELRIPDFDIHKAITLRLDILPKLTVQYSLDDIQWNVLYENACEVMCFKEVGMLAEPKINSFFYDFFICNTQLYFNKKTHEITTYPKLEHDDRYFSNMLDERSIPIELLEYEEDDLIDFIIKQIDMRYYICLDLNITRGQDSGELRGKCENFDIIYGYDKRKNTFNLLSFYGKTMFWKISFKDFLELYKSGKEKNEVLTLHKYKSWKYLSTFNKEMLLENLNAYIAGESSYAVTARKKVLYFDTKEYIYGSSILSEIVDNEDYFNGFIKSDISIRRIQEHYLIILEMLNLMKNINVISDEIYISCFYEYNKLIYICEHISIALKEYNMENCREKKNNILDLLQHMTELDKKTTMKMYNKISSNE